MDNIKGIEKREYTEEQHIEKGEYYGKKIWQMQTLQIRQFS